MKMMSKVVKIFTTTELRIFFIKLINILMKIIYINEN